MKRMTASHLDPRFNRWDWSAAGIVLVCSLILYIGTLAPSVGLEDSGEFITAGVHFGVPHPPGYPLWSIGTFLLSKFLPIGNVAWRVNLFSALCGAGANALLTLLVSHSGRWILRRFDSTEKPIGPKLPFWAAISSGLILTFSDVMWSQSVIAEVYALNALCLMLTLVPFYRWMRTPEDLRWLLLTLFGFCLGLTNHHTLLFLAPAFFIGVILADRAFLPTFFIAVTLLALSALTVLTWFSSHPDLQEITLRLGVVLLLGCAAISIWFTPSFSQKRFLRGSLGTLLFAFLMTLYLKEWLAIESIRGASLLLLTAVVGGLIGTSKIPWRFLCGTLIVGWIALSLYGYMRLSSSTNPPMNWGFANEKGGFYHAVSRGQYGDSLTVLIRGKIGPLVGVTLERSPTEDTSHEKIDYLRQISNGMRMYYRSLEDNFSLPLCLLAFPILIYLHRFSRRQWAWILFLISGYLVLAVLMTLISPPAAMDLLTEWMSKVFHLQSHCLLVIAMAYGMMAGWVYLNETTDSKISKFLPALLFFAVIPLEDNVHSCSQYQRWFGWYYGTDMLRPLEKGAIIFGGTDPGRFVPTYTIFCESTQPARWKRDPSFDRSDLYIITQNALADFYYLKYIQSHYDSRYRPSTFNWLERWLGRDHQYPPSIELPTADEFGEAFEAHAKERATQNGAEVSGLEEVFKINGIIARQIFEKNKAKHAFYLEESFPIRWMYDYAEPSGLILKLNPEPLKAISPESIAKDRQFWDRYTAFLLSQPGFEEDPPAQRSFSKLRLSVARLYAYRGLYPEAEYAYKQALQLCPYNSEVIFNYSEMLAKQNRLEDAQALVDQAIARDPHQTQYAQMLETFKAIRLAAFEEKQLREALKENPHNPEMLQRMIQILLNQNKIPEIDPFAVELMSLPETDPGVAQSTLDLLISKQRIDAAEASMRNRMKLEPKNVNWPYALGGIYLLRDKKEDAFKYLKIAVKLSPETILKMAPHDPLWAPVKEDPRFKKIIPGK